MVTASAGRPKHRTSEDLKRTSATAEKSCNQNIPGLQLGPPIQRPYALRRAKLRHCTPPTKARFVERFLNPTPNDVPSRGMRVNRRDVLRMGLCAGTGLFARQSQALHALARAADPVPPLAKLASYIDPLPIPPVIRPSSSTKAEVLVRMTEFRQKVHRDLPPTRLWGYNGVWPGPTFEVRRGQLVSVKWTNQLPMKHFLPIDTTIHGSEEAVPQVRTVVHVHGARVMPESDGYPDAWVTSDGKAGPVASTNPARYSNDQRAATLWYHDHALGITRLNVYAGLAGFYLVRDEEEDALNLPSGTYEIPLLIQDRKFNPDGSLLYPEAQNRSE